MTATPPTAAAFAADHATYAGTTRRFAWADALCLTGLALLFLALVLPYDRLPMQIVDESRNALNALGIDLHGHWLVPYYAGHPDHWNTKPPLLIWQIAALLGLGLPPLLALRLPSLVATAVTIALVWWFCRSIMRDRLAAMLAGILLLTSSLYVGPHVTRTGDYDSLLCLFTTGQALAMFLALEPADGIRIGPFAIWGACLVGAVMTKSTAGALMLPGFLLFAIVRGRLPALLRNARVWLITLAALALCVGYYLSRDWYDPGYLHAVWQNDMGGRFAEAQEHNAGGTFYYVTDLLRRFEPGTLLLPLTLFTLLGHHAGRRSLVLFCLLASAVPFLAVSAAATKLAWYIAPIIPLLSIAAAIAVVDVLAWISRREMPMPAIQRLARPALFALLACAAAVCILRNQAWAVRGLQTTNNDQFWYGNFLRSLHRGGVASVTVVDNGMPNRAGFVDYNPMLRFYAAWESHRGMPVALRRPGTELPPGTAVATCDPASLAWLRTHEDFAIQRRDPACVFGHITAPHVAARNG